MRIGNLCERVTILLQQVLDDGVGGQSRTFTELVPAWAQVLPTRPGDLEPVAEAAAGVQGYRITIRYRGDIGINNRIDWNGRRLNVLAAADMTGRRKFLTVFTDLGVVTD
jgi:SPP1 family predicted phage head-tail adaptor